MSKPKQIQDSHFPPRKTRNLLTFLLYALPILFFIVCYFVIVTSGEDILQGANTPPDIINDALSAFHHSARLADMFAWAIINFFNYTFSFGIDTIFRILDLCLVFSVLYLATHIILQRRPRFKLTDALTFNFVFLFLILTANGTALYSGFSKIHNYLPILLSTLIFGIFYLRDIWHKPTSTSPLFKLFMLILGFIFGLTSNITPIAFLLTFAIYTIYRLIRLRKNHKPIKSATIKFTCSWQFMGTLGVIIALIIMYSLSDLGDYTSSSVYTTVHDYLPLSNLLSNPLGSLWRIFLHIISNFACFLTPFIVTSIPILFYFYRQLKPEITPSNQSTSFRQRLHLFFSKLLKLLNLRTHDKAFLFLTCTFIITHLLVLSQIYYPPRLILPAYLCAVCIYLWIIKRLLSAMFMRSPHSLRHTISQKQCPPLKPALITTLTLSIIVLSTRTFFAIDYVIRITPVLEDIKTSDQTTICIDKSIARSKNLVYVFLGQEDFIEEWAMPQTIYGKTIVYCEQKQ